jgi:hypothetical protein
MIEDIQDLFKINSGIEIHFVESKDIASENIRNITTKNFKINPLNNKEDFSRRLMRNFSPITYKKKNKIFEGISPMAKHSSKKNISAYPITIPNIKISFPKEDNISNIAGLILFLS